MHTLLALTLTLLALEQNKQPAITKETKKKHILLSSFYAKFNFCFEEDTHGIKKKDVEMSK